MAKIINELKGYQAIPRKLIFDKNMSDRARFVYCFMAAKPEDWEFFLEPMARDLGYGTETLRKYINELVAGGWLVRGKQKTEDGRFSATEYVIRANKTLPCTENTDTEKNRHGIFPTQDNIDYEHNKDCVDNKEKKEVEKELKEKDIEEFVDKVYKMYPTKCPIRGVSLGKTNKDKTRIKSLLRTYSKEEIIKVVEQEVRNKYGKYSLRNFATFLNNFPDPNEICDNTTPQGWNNTPLGFKLQDDRRKVMSELPKQSW